MIFGEVTFKKVRAIERINLSLHERVNLLLVYGDQKPATELNLVTDDLANYNVKNNTFVLNKGYVQKIEKTLSKLKLCYQKGTVVLSENKLGNFFETQSIYVARNKDSLDKLNIGIQTMNERFIGQVYGLPETAIDAFLGLREISYRNLRGTDLEFFQIPFFSKEFYDEEIKTLMRWKKTLNRLSESLSKEIIDFVASNELEYNDPYWREDGILYGDYGIEIMPID